MSTALASAQCTGDEYWGSRDEEHLTTWIEKEIGRQCNLEHQDLCSEEQLAEYTAAKKMTSSERIEQIADKEADIQEAEDALHKRIQEIHELELAATKIRDDIVATAEPTLRILRSVQRHTEKVTTSRSPFPFLEP